LIGMNKNKVLLLYRVKRSEQCKSETGGRMSTTFVGAMGQELARRKVGQLEIVPSEHRKRRSGRSPP